MCTGIEPALIAAAVGTAASVAGSHLQNQAQQKNAEARADARNAVLRTFQDKNEQLSQEARTALDKRLAMEEQTPQEAAEAPRRERADSAASVMSRGSSADPIPLGGNVPTVVSDDFAKGQEDTASAASDRADALAATRAFGDMLFNKGLATQGTGRDIGMVNTFAQANSRLLPHQQDLAEQSKMGVGRGMGSFGGVLGSLGSGLSSAAGAGMFSGAGSGLTSAQQAANAGRTAPVFAPVPRPRPVNLGL